MRIIPTIDATARRNALRGAGAVLVSSSLVFASLGLPAAPAAAAHPITSAPLWQNGQRKSQPGTNTVAAKTPG